jgi:hypothetical protein
VRRWVNAAAVGLLLVAPAAAAGVIDRAEATLPTAERTWLVWGGETSFRFNPDELQRLDLGVERVDGASARTVGVPGIRYEAVTFPALTASELEIRHEGRVISGIGGGSLRHEGGFVLGHGAEHFDLRGFSIRASAGSRLGLDIVDGNGVTWLTADHAHYGFEDEASSVFSMRHMNLRLSAHFAHALGHPEWEGRPVGLLAFRAHAFAGDAAEPAVPCNAPWPDPPSAPAGIELIDSTSSGFSDDVYVLRCQGCTTGSTNGRLVVAQDSSLRNAGNTGIAWYGKFDGIFPPYGNDQHPYLIWNLYRVDADGALKQIGVSGVKHAFYAVNFNCGCDGGHVLYPTCADTYSSGSNDSSSDIGPRSEILPHTGQWGRCGSVYDANCDGVQDAGGGAHDLYEFRMNVIESDLQPPLSTGASYYLEYWYVARDDDAIYNSMGYRQVTFQKNGANWMIDQVPSTTLQPGPVVNTWVTPGASANAANAEMSSPLGRARVAVRITDLGNGQWRYRYVVMNFDYSHAEIDPAHPSEPNLHVTANHGFKTFRVPVPASVPVGSLGFRDADLDAGNDWTATRADGFVTWTAPAGQNTLDWGTLYGFELVAGAGPADGDVELVGVATSTEPELVYATALRVPQGGGNEYIFSNGFD